MAIKAFSGVRTEEIFFHGWEHIHFRRGKGYYSAPLCHKEKASPHHANSSQPPEMDCAL